MKRIITFLFFSAAVLFAANSFAQFPRLISYQGYLTDASSKPIEGKHNLKLRLIDAAGNVVYTEIISGVDVKNGIFNVIIGSTIPSGIPQALTFNEQYFLGVAVDAGTELLPRTPLISAPYALRAQVANNVAPGADVVTTLNTKSGAIRLVGGGTTTITTGGDSILISSVGGSGSGIQGVQSSDGSLSISSPNGPTADIRFAGAKTTAPITGNGTSVSPLAIASANATTNGYISSTDWTTFNNKLSTVSVAAPELSGTGTSGTPIKLAQQGATNGQVLTWNGTSWSPAAASGLTLPYTASVNSASTLFNLTNTGTGSAIEGASSGVGTAGVLGATTSANASGVEAQYTGAGVGIAMKVTGGYMKVAGPTKTAIQHTTAAGNINNNTTLLNYPGMAATDMLFITHKFGQAFLVGGCGVQWNGNAWLIYNENAALNMPIGETFNVLIIKQ